MLIVRQVGAACPVRIPHSGGNWQLMQSTRSACRVSEDRCYSLITSVTLFAPLGPEDPERIGEFE